MEGCKRQKEIKEFLLPCHLCWRDVCGGKFLLHPFMVQILGVMEWTICVHLRWFHHWPDWVFSPCGLFMHSSPSLSDCLEWDLQLLPLNKCLDTAKHGKKSPFSQCQSFLFFSSLLASSCAHCLWSLASPLAFREGKLTGGRELVKQRKAPCMVLSLSTLCASHSHL